MLLLLQIHERTVTLRQQVSSLDLIVGIYNNIQRTLSPIERPLLEPRLTAVNATLAKGLLVCAPALQHACIAVTIAQSSANCLTAAA